MNIHFISAQGCNSYGRIYVMNNTNMDDRTVMSLVRFQLCCHAFLHFFTLAFCERYELKIDYVAMDQVCTWSRYKVDILLYD